MFKTTEFCPTASETVKELAVLCSLPFQQIQCGPQTQITSLIQLLNGAAMADTWVMFENMEKLNFTVFTVLIKEIQIL